MKASIAAAWRHQRKQQHQHQLIGVTKGSIIAAYRNNGAHV